MITVGILGVERCRWIRISIAIIFLVSLTSNAFAQSADLNLRSGEGKQWFKGNTHTHTLWSDGDAAPELATAWYYDRGYHFLCLSDHNIMNDGSVEKWYPVIEGETLSPDQVDLIAERFGPDWVFEKEIDGQRSMQLKTLPELRGHFEEPGKFVLITAEEVTGSTPSVHINAINTRELILPRWGKSIPEMIDLVFDQVQAQSEASGVPMVAHIDHPNWGEGVTTEELIAAAPGKYFEVYNGHGGVRNWGSESLHYPSTDRHWDIVLSMQMKDGPTKPLYGFGTDDTHAYFEQRIGLANAGRGWTMVLAESLDADSIVRAMQQGHFYASSGVSLTSIEANTNHYSVEIDAVPGVTYTTQFIGTMKGFDASSDPVLDADGNPIARASHRYSADIGRVLQETTGNSAVYRLNGDELYVRAKIVSSKEQENPFAEGDFETAWAPPFVNP
jgi:hypothetical protein